MKSLIILGDSGFIGSGFLNQTPRVDRKIVGINRHRIFVSKHSTTQQFPRETPELSEEILPFLEEDTVVVNAVWGKNNRVDRDSAVHNDYVKAEMLLIDALKKSGCHYMSFGSIAEIDDESISPSHASAYSEAKKILASYLEQSGLAYNWLRVASLYGPGDKRDWLLPRLLESLQRGEQVDLENPSQQINLCHVDSFVKGALTLLENGVQGTFNVATDQWLTVSELKKGFTELREPIYLMRILGPFSKNDPNLLHLSTPPVIDFITEQLNSHKS